MANGAGKFMRNALGMAPVYAAINLVSIPRIDPLMAFFRVFAGFCGETIHSANVQNDLVHGGGGLVQRRIGLGRDCAAWYTPKTAGDSAATPWDVARGESHGAGTDWECPAPAGTARTEIVRGRNG